ncbi:MAG: hypothetical protein NUW02_00365 [Candidatus Campbellbacteria bacterium]|nr:hypothetical protein [Candidatus Campbellbacteria bacterium]
MDSKKFIWLGLFVGSFVGGYVPTLWGASPFGFSSVICTAIGGFLGIYLGLKISS